LSQNKILGNIETIVAYYGAKIEDMQAQLEIAAELRQQVLSLNPNCATIGPGKMAQLQYLAKQINKVGD